MNAESVWIVGAAMTPFGRFPRLDVLDLGAQASRDALADAELTIRDMQFLACGCLSETAWPGQRLLRLIGQTGLPVVNVVNACATGATAVRTAALAVKAGEADLALAVGMEQMGKAGLLGVRPRSDDVFEPKGRNGAVTDLEGLMGSDLMPSWFSFVGSEFAAAREGVGFEQFARVAEKNHAHSTLNPLSQYRKAFSLDEVMSAEMIAYPNTLLMCSPTADGAAAVVLASATKLATLPASVRRRAVKISAGVLTSDPYAPGSEFQHDVHTLTRNAARQAYDCAGVGPEDLDLVELHDCFATAELCHYENLQLCEPGGAGELIDSRATWRDGRIPVNVSGGLLSKGHPIAATGVAGIFEIATHLRGEAGERQIPGARVGLAHVLGGGWSCGVHILERAAC